MKLLRNLPFRAPGPESGGENLQQIPTKLNKPSNKAEFITEAEALVKTVNDRTTKLKTLLSNPNLDGATKEGLTQKLAIMQGRADMYKTVIEKMKTDEINLQVPQTRMMQSRGITVFTASVNTLIMGVNQDIAGKIK